MQLCHLARNFHGMPISFEKAATTFMESVSKQMLSRCMLLALSMATITAQNSASRGVAWPMLLEIAPRMVELASLITTPMEPQGLLPKEEPSQLSFTLW